MSSNALRAVVATVLACALVGSVALAGAADDPGEARVEQASASQQIKKLNRKLKNLKRRVGTLEGERGQPRPPSGAAGGALNGEFPNPGIAPGAIGGAEIADGAVGTSELADLGVSTTKLANASVGSEKIANGAVAPQDIGTVPAARAIRTTNQTLTHNTTTGLSFDSERFDTAEMHSQASGDVRIPIDGIYLVSAGVRWAGNVTGSRLVESGSSGGRVAQSWIAPNGASSTDQTVTTAFRFTAGQSVHVDVFQTSGGNLDVVRDQVASPELTVVWLAP